MKTIAARILAVKNFIRPRDSQAANALEFDASTLHRLEAVILITVLGVAGCGDPHRTVNSTKEVAGSENGRYFFLRTGLKSPAGIPRNDRITVHKLPQYETAAAIAYVEEGHARAKVVIIVQ